MDLYTLDSNFTKKDMVEGWTSLIWTERYNQFGDVTLVWSTNNSSMLDSLVVEGTFLHIPESQEVMLIETVSTESGVTTATGISLVGFLQNRMFRNTWQTTSNSWNLTGAAGTLANYIVTQMCIAGGIMAGTAVIPGGGASEVIPKLSVSTAPTGTSINVAVEYGDVYTAVKAVCDMDNLGFTLYPPSTVDGTGNMLFRCYRGLDRTTDQNLNEVVIFEPALDSFTDVTEVRSIAGYKNVAYAWAQGMTAQAALGIALAPGVGGITGFQRRTLMVDASDVNTTDYPTTAALKAVLDQRARDALLNNNYVRLTDGTIIPQVGFFYGEDYLLGDVIELRGPSNTAQQARVVEYIRAQDATGVTAYPTLSAID